MIPEKPEDLWKLIAQSRLFSPEECRKLAGAFSKEQPAAGSPSAVAEWLVAKRYISRYQAKVLLSGHPGPFVYGSYVVYDRITAGRLAGRFSARHVTSKQKVCLQFLTGPAAHDSQTLESVKQQAAFASGLSDPRLARCLEFVDLGNFRFLVLEDLRGGTVEERLRTQGAIPADEARRLAQQAALGLARLHAAGQIHGDVRPENLWLEEGHLKVWHFPVARDPLTAPPWQARPETWGPQAGYLAPELTQPGWEPDARSDIYSLGCTLYQMLTGQPPQPDGPTSPELSQPTREAPAANRINASVPAELAALVSRLMSPDPQSRPPRALDVADLLGGRRVSQASVSEVPQQSATLDLPDEEPVTAVADTTTVESGFPIVVTPAVGAVSARTRLAAKRRSRNRLPLVISGLALTAIAAAAALAFVRLRPEPLTGDKNAGNPAVAPNIHEELAPGSLAAKAQPVVEGAAPADPEPRTLDGELWASPTSGPPLDLRYLPPGALVVVSMRPAVLLAHPEGEQALDALGPLGELARARLPQITGVEFAEMDQVLLGFLDRAPDPPAVAAVVRTAEPLSETELLGPWGNPKLDDAAPGRLFRGADRAFYVPSGGNQRLLAVMPIKDVQDVLEMGDQPPLLRIEVEKLVRASDADRAVSVLFTPDFLLMPSNSFLSGAATQLKVPLEDVLGSDVKAGLLSCHLDGPNFFAELLVSPAVDRPPMAIAKTLQDRLHAARLRVEDYVRPMSADPYAGKVLFRFPQMLAELEKHTRAAAIDRQVALRCYLPDRAAHNLALATELALTSSGGAAPATLVAAAPPAAPKSVEERLKQVTSLSFPLENLENAIATLSGEIGVEMKILGGDLELEGITRNQQFKDLNEVNKPAGEILRQILIKARPDGKLVYVIGKDGERDVVYITIRSKAQERGQLPPELAP